MSDEEDDLNDWGVFGSAFGILAVVAVAYHVSLPPTPPGRKLILQNVAYWLLVAPTFAIPTSVSGYMFSGLSVTVIGTVFPIYESLRAICTPDEDDDKKWLQYYLVGGIVFICTQCVDEWLGGDGLVYWYQAMFFLYLWLFFPKTDGAAIIYDHFTEPFVAPIVRRLLGKVNNCISFVYEMGVNIIHIAIVVLIFAFFPDSLKKVIAVAVGTVYPLMSSIKAATTEDVADDTYWLTYWVCYSCLFLIMEILEVWIGWVPGFYTVYIAATVYLMLPMFEGADKIFRKILVPLARLQDLLLLRDAVQIKKRLVSELGPDRAKSVRRAIVKFYDDEGETLDEGELKRELVTSWKGVQTPGVGFRGLFRKRVKEEAKDKEEDIVVDIETPEMK